MTDLDTRQVNRDSLFLLAQVRHQGDAQSTRLKVRNLSAQGMMGEGDFTVARGKTVEVDLRNLGWVQGQVAWTQGNRFGVSFEKEIDAKVVRGIQNSMESDDTGFVPVRPRSIAAPVKPGKLRAI